jgi:hypothetical protein
MPIEFGAESSARRHLSRNPFLRIEPTRFILSSNSVESDGTKEFVRKWVREGNLEPGYSYYFFRSFFGVSINGAVSCW